MALRDYKKASTLPSEKESHGKLSFFIIGLLVGGIVTYGCLISLSENGRFDIFNWPKSLISTADSLGKKIKGISKNSSLPPMEFDFQPLKSGSEIDIGPIEGFQQGYLQAGSFRTIEDADGTKAKLAILGIKSEISRVVTAEKNVWFRVLVGPLLSERAIRETRIEMIEQGIIPIFLKQVAD